MNNSISTTDLQASHARVLIVDRSAERREVLGTLLARQGAVPVEAPSVRAAVRIVADTPVDLIVVDNDASVGAALEPLAGGTATPIVVLGKIAGPWQARSGDQLVEKPYHYRDLIRRIDEVLASRRAA